MLTRRGATVVELLVGLTLAGIVLGSATSTLLRQQRSHARIADVRAADGQLHAVTAILAGQLAHLEPADLAVGMATDTSLQFRSPVTHGVACNAPPGSAIALPSVPNAPWPDEPLSGVRQGDSLWWFADSSWRSAAIADVATLIAICSAPIPASGMSVHFAIGAFDTVPAGAPLRVTRQTRYTIYRASNGTFQLGLREWNSNAQNFSAPQPVAGPLLRLAGARRTGFRYHDRAGAELMPSGGPIDVRQIARIRVTATSRVMVRSAADDSIRTDSVDVALRAPPGHKPQLPRGRRGGALLMALALLTLGAALLVGSAAAASGASRSIKSHQAAAIADAESRVTLASIAAGWGGATDSLPIGGEELRGPRTMPVRSNGAIAVVRVRIRRVAATTYVITVDCRVGPDSAVLARRRVQLVLSRPTATDTSGFPLPPVPIARWSLAEIFQD